VATFKRNEVFVPKSATTLESMQRRMRENAERRRSVKLLPIPQRPKCRACGTPLRPYRYRSPEHPERTYGDYGDGLFCGLTCGHRYAVWSLKPKAAKK